MTKLVDGKKIAGEILGDLNSKIKDLGYKPRLVVILVGQNPASLSYIKMKQRRGEDIGVKVDVRNYPENIPQADLETEIQGFNRETDIRGIIIQVPLPGNLDRDAILNAVDPALDIDCLTQTNQKRLIAGVPFFIPPAVAAVMKILEYYDVPPFSPPSPPKAEGDPPAWTSSKRSRAGYEGVGGKSPNILLVGSGDLIGKPLSAMLLNKKISFELANRHTENLTELAKKADVIITGVGKPGLITGDMIKQGAVVIDAGTTGSDEGAVVGDVDSQSVIGKASLLSPVPGGVGPVTVAMLFENLVKLSVLGTQ